MTTVKVRATVHTLGLQPGQEAEIDLDALVVGLIRAGYLLLLKEVASE